MTDESVTDNSRERFERLHKRLVIAAGSIASWPAGAALFDQMNAFERAGRFDVGVRVLRRLALIGSADERLSAQELAAWARVVLGSRLAAADRIEEGVAEVEQLEAMGQPALNVMNVMIDHYRREAETDSSASVALAGAMSSKIHILEALPESVAQDVRRAKNEFLDCFGDEELAEIHAMTLARLAGSNESRAVLDEKAP